VPRCRDIGGKALSVASIEVPAKRRFRSSPQVAGFSQRQGSCVRPVLDASARLLEKGSNHVDADHQVIAEVVGQLNF
jgi:hypothetical protein